MPIEKFNHLLFYWPNVKERTLKIDELISSCSFDLGNKEQNRIREEFYSLVLVNIEEKNYKNFYFFSDYCYIELSKEQYLS
jgi:hypothetical protein